jgi:RNA polymerase sigma-70 factor, ECF subfamily
MNPVADQRLVARDEEFAKLYQAFHPGVLRLCHYMLGSREEAEDAADEVFIRLPRAVQTYDNAQPFSRWLSRVASNYCVDLLRMRRSEQRVFGPADPQAPEPPSSGASPLQELLSQEQKDAVRAAIACMPEHYRVPLVLRYYNDLSYDEIAENLGLSRAHVATLIFRAKEELRRILTRVKSWSHAGVPRGAGMQPPCTISACS